MGIISGTKKLIGKTAKASVAPIITASIVENYIKQMKKEGKSWSNISNIGQYFGGTAIDRVKKIGESVVKQFKNEGGMAYARKKNMGLKMKKGGSVKSKKKVRGTGAAKRGTKFKGTF